ncbi:guanine nucleotide exchange factor SPIKE 1-like [Dioscorea cayenensis subsp. rotundata]|uniref:Guanine nucleotide exchange factor SPIKE 1-like n=1 Tax=Dioscorea cayennensis subsp. rotundata TaxID=55577 RepID=A0AB40C000_DIOCR|nr:guanine nucleotide exchange factor SPIKE 1-like [Dioscorea cayenensis subsp. rotundata]
MSWSSATRQIGRRMKSKIHLARSRHSKVEDATDDDTASTSGRQISEFGPDNLSTKHHFNFSPLPAYEPTFDWETEKSLIFGQRISENYPAQYSSGLKITVKVLSLSFQAGLVEPFYGTICLYNERREKLSEDFYFRVLPTDT